jgi:predicted transcriptional regulator
LRTRAFGELEAVIMDRIWNRGADCATTVRDVFDELSDERAIAYTTVMSTMDNLHGKGWLTRQRDGKAYLYWAVMSREQHGARLMQEALQAGGTSELILSHFLERIGTEEAARLRAALRRLKRRGGRR